MGKAALDAHLATLDEKPAWYTIYEDLMAEHIEVDGKLKQRWDWRKSLYIAWNVVPREARYPRTEQELARLMRLASTRVFRYWKEMDPEIVNRINGLPRQMLAAHAANVYQALVDVAVQPIPAAHQDRKLFLELVGQYQAKIGVGGSDGGPIVIRVVYDQTEDAQNEGQDA